MIFYVRRVMHCAINHKAWIQTRDFASPLALLLDLISSSERSGSCISSSEFERIFIRVGLRNRTSLRWIGKNFFDSGTWSGVSNAIPPMIA